MLRNCVFMVILAVLLVAISSHECLGANTEVFVDDLGKYVYAYPSTSEVDIVDNVVKEGECSLMFNLDQTTYSGGAYALYESLDLSKIKDKALLNFGSRVKMVENNLN